MCGADEFFDDLRFVAGSGSDTGCAQHTSDTEVSWLKIVITSLNEKSSRKNRCVKCEALDLLMDMPILHSVFTHCIYTLRSTNDASDTDVSSFTGGMNAVREGSHANRQRSMTNVHSYSSREA